MDICHDDELNVLGNDLTFKSDTYCHGLPAQFNDVIVIAPAIAVNTFENPDLKRKAVMQLVNKRLPGSNDDNPGSHLVLPEI